VTGVARALGRPVVRHPEIEAAVRSHWGERLTEEALRLANVPEGAQLIRSPRSWYPVVGLDEIYLLPGVPQLFRMHVDSLADRYRTTPFHLRCVYLSSPETAIAAVLDRVAAAHTGVAIGSYPRFDTAEYQVKLTIESKDPAAVEAALRDLLERLPREAVVRVGDEA
jgi:molybdopterin-biosynthesis enzyme MoeA-like protein